MRRRRSRVKGVVMEQVRQRLGADAAARFQHMAAGRVDRVVVQQLGQGLGLVVQPLALAFGVAVDVVVGSHGRPCEKRISFLAALL